MNPFLRSVYLFLKAKYSHLLYLLINPYPVIKRHIDRIASLVALALLIITNIFWMEDIEEGFICNLKNGRYIFDMTQATIHHLQTILLIYVFFGDRILRHLKDSIYEEKGMFHINDFYLDLDKSHKGIMILETFVELLLKDKESFKNHLAHFVERAARNNVYQANIHILLLDPESEYMVLRLKQIRKSYTGNPEFEDVINDEQGFVERFQDKLISWLRDLLEIKKDTYTFAKPFKINLDFEIKLYRTFPPFSLYACDDVGYFGNYGVNTQTTQSRQGVVRNLKNGLTQFQIERFQEIWKVQDERDVTGINDYLRIYVSPRSEAVRMFKKLGGEKDKDKILKILNDLSPDKLKSEDLLSLITYIEKPFQKLKPSPHYHILGTGGDEKGFKTINISTICSILATHYSNDPIIIKKPGTYKVTSQVGSSQFVDSLKIADKSKLIAARPFARAEWLWYNDNSGYVYLKYDDKIVEARQKLFDNRTLDIYKLIYPSADLTGSSAQLTGISDIRYLRYFQEIFHRLNKSGILLYNDTHTDELMRGTNFLYCYDNGQIVETIEIKIEEGDMSYAKYWEFFGETDVVDHIDKFLRLFDPNEKSDVKWTMAYNIAAIIKLKHLTEKEITIRKLAEDIYSYFFEQ